ncbi:hypothetical protein [Rubricoccus marinus]|uniref:Type II secretion system protein GspG C-terminal domain-containing protein n=1 Tax=Rubricoccus marinus TaxID=716817 RepID=A0A259TZ87_9BACT|nr:hypothetical protein [Rubricoccus marinus]OZC02874.1 hypothetical protein BSZ36_07755 [Rubricoccus marinus]
MRLAIQVVLAIAIVVLAYFLFRAIRDPYVEEQARIEQTTIGRERMDDVRSALIAFRDVKEGYPSTLDSLVYFVKNDTAFAMPEMDPENVRLTSFNADSLAFSARNGQRFNYEVVENDTTEYEIYWLQDPGALGDSIGSRVLNPALRNAASWLE